MLSYSDKKSMYTEIMYMHFRLGGFRFRLVADPDIIAGGKNIIFYL